MIFEVSESIGTIIITVIVITLIIPIIPVIYFIIKKIKAADICLMISLGISVFSIFALILEKLCHLIIFSIFPKLKRTIWAYGLYGGFMAALFEETGRLITFYLIHNKPPLQRFSKNDLNSILYGIGHGGFEIYILVTLTYVNNFYLYKMAISGKLDKQYPKMKKNEVENYLNAIQSLNKLSTTIMLYVIIERVIAFTFHICSSVIIWIGVKFNKILKMYLIAFIIHFLSDASIALVLEFKYESKVYSLFYIVIACFSLLSLILSIIFWMNYVDKQQDDEHLLTNIDDETNIIEINTINHT